MTSSTTKAHCKPTTHSNLRAIPTLRFHYRVERARELAGLRSLRLEGSQGRIVYDLTTDADGEQRVEIIAVGPRRESEVYGEAGNRR
jgi:hypothetical protein